MPAGWVTGDEVYGDNGAFRAGIAKLGLGYVLAVSCDHRIAAFPGGRPFVRTFGWGMTFAAARWWSRADRQVQTMN